MNKEFNDLLTDSELRAVEEMRGGEKKDETAMQKEYIGNLFNIAKAKVEKREKITNQYGEVNEHGLSKIDLKKYGIINE